jgi:hypothetical protein
LRFVAPILIAIGLVLVAGSFFVGNRVPTQSAEQEAIYEQAVTDLHGIANRGESSEETKARIAAANQLLRTAEEETAAAEARSRRFSWIIKVVGLLVIACGVGLHFFVASRD